MSFHPEHMGFVSIRGNTVRLNATLNFRSANKKAHNKRHYFLTTTCNKAYQWSID